MLNYKSVGTKNFNTKALNVKFSKKLSDKCIARHWYMLKFNV